MDWLLNHPLVLVFVAIAAANLFQKIKRAGTPPSAPEASDGDAAERTRRVQEEIRRKIAARAARAPVAPPPLPKAPPAVEPPSRQGRPNIFQELAQQMAEARKLTETRERTRSAGATVQARQRVETEQKAGELAQAQRSAVVTQARIATAAAVSPAAGSETGAVEARARLLT
ncbi:MAG TPA: hypothetical protein VK785_06800, partial [Opitutaceae bacterium]|nr:hypothetical protein [Opitutaceae bacterium]